MFHFFHSPTQTHRDKSSTLPNLCLVSKYTVGLVGCQSKVNWRQYCSGDEDGDEDDDDDGSRGVRKVDRRGGGGLDEW